ncbi:MAG TPA: hypothetical protein VGO68_20830 [Pyrinomonadaceae bacterium]|jgi:hypothetical protein|nr:hypothetical protein [Pyrinomonadaceae bacterium]
MKTARRFVSQCARNFTRKIKFNQLRNPLVALFVLVGVIAIVTFSTTSYAERLVNKLSPALMQGKASVKIAKPGLTTDKGSYRPGEMITFTGSNWAPGEAVTITLSGEGLKDISVAQETADKSGFFVTTFEMPETREPIGETRVKSEKRDRDRMNEREREMEEEGGGSFTASAVGSSSRARATAQFTFGIADRDGERMLANEAYWLDRIGYPTRQFDPAWVRQAAEQDAQIQRRIPGGRRPDVKSLKDNPLALSPIGFVALGPQPERMTGCTGCFNYTTTSGRINDIKIDPVTPSVAYSASVGGGVWKTTNCCSAATSWTSVTDDPLLATTSIDTITLDPNNHNTIYAGTGDLNYGSFSMGSQGIYKSTDAGATWTVLGADVFGAGLPVPVGQFPQYQAVGKVRVDPNNSNKIIAGTKTGLYLSYDGGTNWTGPCLTNAFNTQRQDVTGLELTDVGSGVTRIIAALGVRGFASTVQFNLDQNGANGLYRGTMPASGCPTDFTSIGTNVNGFVNGATNMNAGTGTPYGGVGIGNQAGRIDIGIAPSNPNYIYAQVQSIAPNSNSGGSAGCGGVAGCQHGVWATIDGGTTWALMAGSAGNSLQTCTATAGDYAQNWYDQAVTVDPNNPERVFISTYDVYFATRTGTVFNDLTCGYSFSGSAGPVHTDQHAIAFVPGSSSVMLIGHDGGINVTSNANTASATVDPTWTNIDTGFNTIEFYSGDISGNFATSANPQAVGGAQDNGPSSVSFVGSPTGPVQWQMGLGGDGFFARIDPVGTGTSLRFWQGNNSGGLSRCITGCTVGGATWTSKRGAWTGDQQSFILPWELFHGDTTNPANDCGPVGAGTGCGHLIAGTVRVWETITGAAANANGTVTWYVNSPDNLTKGTLGNRSFINQLAFEPKDQTTVIVGTNDGNVQIGRGLGAGSGPLRASGTITTATGGAVAGQTFVVGPQTFTWQTAARSGTGQVQISTVANTAAANILAAILADLPGVVTATRANAVVTVTAPNTGPAGNSIVFTESSTNVSMNPLTGTLAGGSDGVALWTNVTDSNLVLPNRPILDVAFDPTTTTAPIAYAAVGGFNENTPTTPGHVMRLVCTTNCASLTWTDKSGNLPNIPVDSIIANPNVPNQVFAGTDFGLYYTDDISVAVPTWYRFNIGLPNVMIWDMSIDRGNTTLALWTRSRGAYAWPLPLAPLNPPVIDPASSAGTYGGTTSLSATMTSGGNPVPGKTINFTLNGNSAGSALTNGSGVATIPSASLSGINAGTYPTGVGATFAGDINYATASGADSLIVNVANQTITVNTPAPASAVHGSQFVVAATSDSGLPVAYSSSGSCTNSGPTFTMTLGTGTCTVNYNQAGDSNHNPAPQVTQTVNATECVTPTNIAAGSYGASAVGSSTVNANFPAAGAIDGERNGNTWGSGGGWNDGTRGVSPDDLQVNFNVTQTFGEIDVYTLKNDFNSGSIVNDTTTFTSYGITSFNVQYWTGAAWVDVPGGAVTGNNLVKRKFVFPDITTNQIRVLVNASADGSYSRVVEVEAYSCNPAVVPPPSPTPTPTPTPCASPSNNVARSTAGANAIATSTVNANFPAAGAIDGEHNGNNWGSSGGWNDGTRGVFPDNIQVNFSGPKTIREIDVYTLKNDFNSGSIVSDITTFTSYGITSFNVQYWDGAAWVDVPGGVVIGNNLVKRKFIFGDITTDKIRVVVNDSADHLYSRIVEIEAFACSP